MAKKDKNTDPSKIATTAAILKAVKRDESFWPSDLKPGSVSAPKKILSQQAEKLGKETDGRVTAEVVTMKRPNWTGLIFGLNLVAPALNHYRLRVLRIEHAVTKLYPVEIIFMLEMKGDEYRTFVASDEAVFVKLLREILGGPRVRETITALLAQSEDLPLPPPRGRRNPVLAGAAPGPLPSLTR